MGKYKDIDTEAEENYLNDPAFALAVAKIIEPILQRINNKMLELIHENFELKAKEVKGKKKWKIW